MKSWTAGFVIMLAAGTVAAQTDDPFWSQPDQVVRDDAGRITYQEIRDRAHSTVRVYSNGTWATQHYRPHTTQLLQVEEGNTTEEWLYDEQGTYAGLRVHLDGIVLTARSEHDLRLGAPGMGPLTLERDQDARITSIRDGNGADLARFQFDAKGYLRSITTGAQTLELTPPAADGRVGESLKSTDGRITGKFSRPESNPDPHSSSFCLDPIRAQLGLGDDWQKQLAFRRASSSVTVAAGAGGHPLFYILRSGGNSWVFDATGKPLLIDFAIPLVASSVRGVDTALAIHEQRGFAPDHIVVTADGRIGGCTSGAASGAIASFWTEHGR
jgi:hypothetical protein